MLFPHCGLRKYYFHFWKYISWATQWNNIWVYKLPLSPVYSIFQFMVFVLLHINFMLISCYALSKIHMFSLEQYGQVVSVSVLWSKEYGSDMSSSLTGTTGCFLVLLMSAQNWPQSECNKQWTLVPDWLKWIITDLVEVNKHTVKGQSSKDLWRQRDA